MTLFSDFPSPDFALDTNVFIQAYQRYYRMELCPGFWDCLAHYGQERRLLSIDRVFDELVEKTDLLSEWARSMESAMFVPSSEPAVQSMYAEMQAWAQRVDPPFTHDAKHQFTIAADGWLAAYAKVHDAVVVTEETYDANTRKRIKLPNLCDEFDVRVMDTFDMLRELGARFEWRLPPRPRRGLRL